MVAREGHHAFLSSVHKAVRTPVGPRREGEREKGMPDVVRAAVQHEETLLQSGLRRGMKT